MAKKPTTKKPAAEKKPSLDIKDVMLYADYKVFDWLESQTPDMAKTFSPLIAMKWQSVVMGYDSFKVGEAIQNVNELVNVGFWDLSKHPELQWKLMCAAGPGEEQRHGWVPLGSRRKAVSKLDTVLLDIHPSINDEELALLKSKFTTDSLKQLLLDMGLPDNEIKPLVDEFKKTHG